MTAPARLLGLRLQGFKSFAERTTIEFGSGISAVVGPNGSGKSNLVDGLRWALGEQGRSLRTRRNEDVIWAGSERRAAQGMADVTLVIDNADGLLPVDFGVVELGRRLYRSGDNDYLLNKQRVRLRDVVDLLDSAHLAENAFLFIGQGMVDQALALRPEERRPLFEEVAGVRRHERRRRKAVEQLAESEANLARVEDVLAELRPQARRLGQLAELQASRLTAGDDLARGLLHAAHARWHETASTAAGSRSRQEAARAEVDHAVTALEQAETAVARIAASLATRADVEREGRAVLEAARSETTALRLQEGGLAAEVAAIGRDRRRIDEEREAAEADLAVQRRALAAPVPGRDAELEAALAEAERALAEALSELGTLRASSRARGDELAALRRAESARVAEAEMARRRAAESERRADEERASAEAAATDRAEAQARAEAAADHVRELAVAETEARHAREAAQRALEVAEGRRAAATDRATSASAAATAARGRLDVLTHLLEEEEARGIAKAARRLGGRRLDEELAVDPPFRAAIEAVLGELVRAYVLPRASVVDVAPERGTLIVADALGGAPAPGGTERFADAVRAAGGGPLAEAVRRDPLDAVRPLLWHVAWLPDLASCLRFQPELPTGWRLVALDGAAVVDQRTVRLGRGDSPLERRAEAERLARDSERLADEQSAAVADREAAAEAAQAARSELERARDAEWDRSGERQAAEEAERAAGRELERFIRESEWLTAQADRLAAEAARARQAAAELVAAGSPEGPRAGGDDGDRGAIMTWQTRAAELRARRDRLAAQHAEQTAASRAAEGARARAEAAVAMDERRIETAAREVASLADRERALTGERQLVATSLAAAVERETRAAAALDELLAADAGDRSRLAEAERRATGARERLRGAEERLRVADVADLEARLALDSVREQLLVELASLGEVGIRHLEAVATDLERGSMPAQGDAEDPESARLERAFAVAAVRWQATPPEGDPPSSARLAVLRRRFHEVGAANPFAIEEFEALKERLDTLDTQAGDLRDAIAKTRSLIAELDELIATRFRATFVQLESAFDARFRQLFGGGFARLSLTDPTDLTATGIEIVARPSGKKAQPLSMLSGGERALTAVALLFAMLEVRPVPFCVLDEVDAALDEANVGRFTEALRGLAERTQFIVITHNRGTIEAADALYGVTLGDDSVSHVISLRLEEAQALADRQRRPGAAALVGSA